MSPPPKDMRELFANLPASLREKNPQLDALSARAIEAAPPSERAAVETALARRALDTRRGRTAAAVGDRFEDWLDNHEPPATPPKRKATLRNPPPPVS